MGKPTLAEATDARHTDTLPTPHYREQYASLTADALDAIANAARDMADKLRMDPNGMLAKAFQPTTIGMDPSVAAEFEIAYVADDKPLVAVKGRTRVVQTEFGFRAVWRDGKVEVTRDNSIGS